MAEATNLALGTTLLAGDLSGTALMPTLRPTGVLPGTYDLANLIVNTKGLVLDAIDGDPTLLPCGTDSVCGTVIVGKNISVTGGQISVPIATTSNKGLVQVGEGFVMDGCVLRVDYPIATTTTLGVVKVPTSGNITVDGSGNIGVPIATNAVKGLIKYSDTVGKVGEVGGKASLILPIATTSVLGGVKLSGAFSIDGTGVLSYTGGIQAATESTLGGMQVGAGLDVDIDGVVNVDLTEVLSAATESTIGAIKIGNGLDIDGSGIVTVDPTEILATTGVAGCVRVGTNIGVTSGVISVADATTSTKGILSITTDTGLSMSSSVLSGADATTSTKGILRVDIGTGAGTGVSISGGVLSLANASLSVKGVVQVSTGLSVSSGVLSGADATTSTKGILRINTGSGLSFVSGNLSGVNATTSVKGIISIGSRVNVNTGQISLPLAESNTDYGIVKSNNTNNISIFSGQVNVSSDIPTLDVANIWTKAQDYDIQNLMFDSNITPPYGKVFFIELSGDCTLHGTVLVPIGTTWYFIFAQDATGGHVVSFPPSHKFNTSQTTISTGSGAISLVTVTKLAYGSPATSWVEKYACSITNNFL